MFNLPSRMFNTFWSHTIKGIVKKAHTGNKPTTIYPCDKLILMGSFQLQLFHDSVIFVGDSCKISEHKLSEYFSLNKSSDQSFCTNTSKSQHRETQVEIKGCLVVLSPQTKQMDLHSMSKDSILHVNRGVERIYRRGCSHVPKKKNQGNLWERKSSWSKWSTPLLCSNFNPSCIKCEIAAVRIWGGWVSTQWCYTVFPAWDFNKQTRGE